LLLSIAPHHQLPVVVSKLCLLVMSVQVLVFSPILYVGCFFLGSLNECSDIPWEAVQVAQGAFFALFF
jgi:hypothetical protein